MDNVEVQGGAAPSCRIIVPFDISEYSRAAAKEAIALAQPLNGSVDFIHIVEEEPAHEIMYTSVSADKLVENEIAETAREWYSPFAHECHEKHIPAELHIIFHKDSVTHTISDYARKLNADLIVIGHHHIHGFGKWTEEAVSRDILDHAPCPVLVAIRK